MTSAPTKTELKRIVAVARKEADLAAVNALLESVSDLTLGELIELSEDPSPILGIRCGFLSRAFENVNLGLSVDMYGKAKKKARRKAKDPCCAKSKDENDVQQTLPATDSTPQRKKKAPPRSPKESPDPERDQSVLQLIQDAGEEGISSKDIVEAVGCSPACARSSIERLREAGKVESSGQKRGQRHHAIETREDNEPQTGEE
jgi:biotin operon repressor